MKITAESMTVHEARAIMATVLATRGAEPRIGPLLQERRRLLNRGDVVLAGETERTIDALCGHWHEGQWIGAGLIDRASELSARYQKVGQ